MLWNWANSSKDPPHLVKFCNNNNKKSKKSSFFISAMESQSRDQTQEESIDLKDSTFLYKADRTKTKSEVLEKTNIGI